MASVIVCGGGVIGLSTAMMLARDGHEVTVLEANAQGPPGTPAQAWEAWDRNGVAQFRQPHNLLARFRQVCDEELPGLTDRLQTAGLVWTDPVAVLPRGITDRDPRAGDEVFRFVTGRRPVAEFVFATAAQEQPGVAVRRGVQVAELIAGPSAVPGLPHVAGYARQAARTCAATSSSTRWGGARGHPSCWPGSALQCRLNRRKTAGLPTTPGTSTARPCRSSELRRLCRSGRSRC